MLGRQVGGSLLRLPIYARLPLRLSPFQCQQDVTSRALLLSSQRFYATPGRPRKAVGEPSRPVKRAVKRNAKSTSKNDPATKQVKAKKAAAAKKKPATRKRRIRKELTEKQKEAKETKVAKAKITGLKKAALSPPAAPTYAAYNMFMKEKGKGMDGKALHGPNRSENMRKQMAPIIEEWKSLSPAELEHYNHLAHQATEAGQAEYKRWVESHTPEQIQVANNARRQLRRKLELKGTQKYSQIKDERAVKRPASAYIQFAVNRQASGDFKNISIGERAKLIGQEWKALSESEKKKYKDLQSEDFNRYSTEYKDVYGHMPPSMMNGQPQAAAAAV